MQRLVAGVFALFILSASTVATAWAAPDGDPGKPAHGCDQAAENDGDAYDSTCDGSPSGNGNGGGGANGKPCAGCVGAADNKNPPGQAPDGSDDNAGYECDRNSGVGRSNPAHTGCAYNNPAPSKSNKKFTGQKAFTFRSADKKAGPTGGLLVVVTALLLSLVYGGSIVARRFAPRA